MVMFLFEVNGDAAELNGRSIFIILLSFNSSFELLLIPSANFSRVFFGALISFFGLVFCIKNGKQCYIVVFEIVRIIQI